MSVDISLNLYPVKDLESHFLRKKIVKITEHSQKIDTPPLIQKQAELKSYTAPRLRRY